MFLFGRFVLAVCITIDATVYLIFNCNHFDFCLQDASLQPRVDTFLQSVMDLWDPERAGILKTADQRR